LSRIVRCLSEIVFDQWRKLRARLDRKKIASKEVGLDVVTCEVQSSFLNWVELSRALCIYCHRYILGSGATNTAALQQPRLISGALSFQHPHGATTVYRVGPIYFCAVVPDR